jgi:polysaccharide export outer membrane protein
MINYRLAFFGLLLLAAASCKTPKRTVYFSSDAKAPVDTTIIAMQPRPQLTITPDDIIAVNVSSADAEKDVAVFADGGVPYVISAQSGAMGAMGAGGAGAPGTVKGFLVGPDGNIEFPVVGKIQLNGLTLGQAKEVIATKLREYVKGPVVDVRVVNYKVNIFGEVNRVGPVIAPNHKLSIVDAITAAGDIPITGRKDNIKIYREENGKLVVGTIDLNSKSAFTSPYYYLQKNDMVYVEPNRIKRQETNEFLRFYLPAIASVLTSVLSVYGIVQLTK